MRMYLLTDSGEFSRYITVFLREKTHHFEPCILHCSLEEEKFEIAVSEAEADTDAIKAQLATLKYTEDISLDEIIKRRVLNLDPEGKSGLEEGETATLSTPNASVSCTKENGAYVFRNEKGEIV